MRFLGLCVLVGSCFAACSGDSGGGDSSDAGASGLGGSAGSAGASGSPNGGAGAGSGGDSGAAGAGLGGAGEGGASGGSDGGAGASGDGPFVAPALLSETGLYSDIENETLAPGVREYAPRFELWSDGAAKRRWVYLPPGSTIDASTVDPLNEPNRTTPMDYWRYPVGTKLWKEFSRDGVRVETRLIQKYRDRNQRERWFMQAFVWNDENDADAAPDGLMNARGTDHDVPSQTLCGECHNNAYDRVLGFTALQLSHTAPGVTLADLIAEDRLTEAPAGPLELPGTEAQRSALGYLHANCGHCHNDFSQHASISMRLLLRVGALGSLEETAIYATTVNQATRSPDAPPDDVGVRITPRNPAESELYRRMAVFPPGEEHHMPQIASEETDPDGVDRVRAFIESL